MPKFETIVAEKQARWVDYKVTFEAENEEEAKKLIKKAQKDTTDLSWVIDWEYHCDDYDAVDVILNDFSESLTELKEVE